MPLLSLGHTCRVLTLSSLTGMARHAREGCAARKGVLSLSLTARARDPSAMHPSRKRGRVFMDSANNTSRTTPAQHGGYPACGGWAARTRSCPLSHRVGYAIEPGRLLQSVTSGPGG